MNHSSQMTKAWVVAGAIFLGLAQTGFSSTLRGGDHGGPSPFEGMNQRFELADGEYYTLYGTIMIAPSANGQSPQAYLRVDLTREHWLASSRRIEMPFYPIEGDVSFWQKYEHRTVKFPCQAEGKIVTGSDGQAHYYIFLRPYTDRD